MPGRGRPKKEKVAAETVATSTPTSADKFREILTKEIGKDAVPSPTDIQHVDTISTGLLSLDGALVIGGYPRGRIITVAGPQHSGKTALALHSLATFQRAFPDEICGIVDIEQTLTESLMQLCGVDTSPSRLVIVQPDNAEAALRACLHLFGCESKDDGKTWHKVRPGCKMVIYDSWAGSPTEEVGLATLARIGAKWLPTISVWTKRTNTVLVIINQIRFNPGAMFTDPEYSPGGETLKHVRSIELKVHAFGKEKDETNTRVGHSLRIHIAKNKLAPPFKTVEVDFNYHTGFDSIADAWAVLQLASVDLRETPGSGNTYKFLFDSAGTIEEVRAVGKGAFIKELKGDPDAAEAFIEYARECLKGYIDKLTSPT